jgi:hypothetical protein
MVADSRSFTLACTTVLYVCREYDVYGTDVKAREANQVYGVRVVSLPSLELTVVYVRTPYKVIGLDCSV